mmetsp:Transcript_1491/g.5091  ORF Transcript_1491/g.5091 Transcript_1491/m.5091 type:complete len:283 (+) Transcript_1491:114-962(+)
MFLLVFGGSLAVKQACTCPLCRVLGGIGAARREWILYSLLPSLFAFLLGEEMRIYISRDIVVITFALLSRVFGGKARNGNVIFEWSVFLCIYKRILCGAPFADNFLWSLSHEELLDSHVIQILHSLLLFPLLMNKRFLSFVVHVLHPSFSLCSLHLDFFLQLVSPLFLWKERLRWLKVKFSLLDFFFREEFWTCCAMNVFCDLNGVFVVVVVFSSVIGTIVIVTGGGLFLTTLFSRRLLIFLVHVVTRNLFPLSSLVVLLILLSPLLLSNFCLFPQSLIWSI